MRLISQHAGFLVQICIFSREKDQVGEGEGHRTGNCRRATYPESYVTKYTTCAKIDKPEHRYGCPGAAMGTVVAQYLALAPLLLRLRGEVPLNPKP